MSKTNEMSVLPQVMNIETAADYFGVSKNFLRTGMRNGQIAHIKIGHKYYVNVKSFQNQIDCGVNFSTNVTRRGGE